MSGSDDAPGGEPAAVLAEPKDGWQARVARLGRAGIIVYASIHVLTISVFYAALGSPSVREQPWVAEHLGPESAVPGGGLFVTAWLLSKALMVPRAALTCAVTPFVARPLNALWAKVAVRLGRGE